MSGSMIASEPSAAMRARASALDRSVMSPELLVQICKEKGLYRTPDLNDKLYLHFGGFKKIENLEEYTAVKCLWVEGNAISTIEGLDHMTELRQLNINQNLLSTIGAGVAKLSLLVNLNVSDNFLIDLNGVETLPNLRTLNASGNKLSTPESIEAAKQCTQLDVFDLRRNDISDPTIIDTFTSMPALAVLYLDGNAVTRNIAPYRKKVLAALPALKYLDESPVFDSERQLVTAWAAGGNAAEQGERERQRKAKAAEHVARLDAFSALLAEAQADAESKKMCGEDDEPTLYYKLNHAMREGAEEEDSPDGVVNGLVDGLVKGKLFGGRGDGAAFGADGGGEGRGGETSGGSSEDEEGGKVDVPARVEHVDDGGVKGRGVGGEAVSGGPDRAAVGGCSVVNDPSDETDSDDGWADPLLKPKKEVEGGGREVDLSGGAGVSGGVDQAAPRGRGIREANDLVVEEL